MISKLTEISRVNRSRKEAKAFYDKVSKWYDIIAGRFERKYGHAGLQMLDVKEGEIVLEIGFGTGHCILALAQSTGNSGKVYGIDISEGMYTITRSRIRDAGLSERVKLTCSDAAELPYGDDFFDAIFMSFTLELFDTPEITCLLFEIQRVLKNGGRLGVVALSRKKKAGVRIYEWFHRKFPNYVDCRPIFVKNMLEDAGFKILDKKEMSMWSLPVEVVVAKKV